MAVLPASGMSRSWSRRSLLRKPRCWGNRSLRIQSKLPPHTFSISAEIIPSSMARSEEHTSELQSQSNLVCRLLLEKKKIHDTLSDIDLDDIDLGVKFFGKRLQPPLIISSMTRDFVMGNEINSTLANVAAQVRVALC